jgi:hypothetical protein
MAGWRLTRAWGVCRAPQEGLCEGPAFRAGHCNATVQFGRGDRHSTSAEVDERTNMQLYFPPFEAAVEAGVLSVMCGNNLVNGEYVCQSDKVMNGMLKGYAKVRDPRESRVTRSCKTH